MNLPEDFFQSFTPENIIEHRTFVLCSQIFSPLYFSINQAIWQLTRGKNYIFTNSLQPIVNLLFVFFIFSTGVAPMAPVAPGQGEAAKLRTTPAEERIAAVII